MSVKSTEKVRRNRAIFAENMRRAQVAATDVAVAGCGCGATFHFLCHPCFEHALLLVGSLGFGVWRTRKALKSN